MDKDLQEVVDPTVSCQACEAACCRDVGDGTALVSAEDIVRWRRTKREDVLASLVPGHFGQQGFATHANGTCVHLGTASDGNACSIYDTRGEACRALVPGSRQCLSYRRQHYGDRQQTMQPMPGIGVYISPVTGSKSSTKP